LTGRVSGLCPARRALQGDGVPARAELTGRVSGLCPARRALQGDGVPAQAGWTGRVSSLRPARRALQGDGVPWGDVEIVANQQFEGRKEYVNAVAGYALTHPYPDGRGEASIPCLSWFISCMDTSRLRAYPKNCNLFACGVIAVRAAGLFGQALRRGSPTGLSTGERDALPQARAGGLPACQPRLQSPGGERKHPVAQGSSFRHSKQSRDPVCSEPIRKTVTFSPVA